MSRCMAKTIVKNCDAVVTFEAPGSVNPAVDANISYITHPLLIRSLKVIIFLLNFIFGSARITDGLYGNDSHFLNTAFSALIFLYIIPIRVVPVLHFGLSKDEEADGRADDEAGGQQVDGAPAGKARHVFTVLGFGLTLSKTSNSMK